MALLMQPDGNVEDVKPNTGPTFTLDELQKHIGGSVEKIPCTINTRILLVDEDGKIKGLPMNEAVTELCRLYEAIRPADYIVGPVLILSAEEFGLGQE